MDEESTLPWPPVKEVLRNIRKGEWKRRLEEAIADGLEVEGSAAVHAAITSMIDAHKIKPARGRPTSVSLPPNIRRAVRFWWRNPKAELKELAAEAGVSIPTIWERMHQKPWDDAIASLWAAQTRLNDRKRKQLG